PLPTRLALRDAGRQSMRSVPALAAIIAVLAIAVGVQTHLASEEAREQALYAATYRGSAMLLAPDIDPETAPDERSIEEVVATAQQAVGPSQRIDLRGVRFDPESAGQREIFLGSMTCDSPDDSSMCLYLAREDRVTGPFELFGGSLFEASPEALDLFLLDDAARSRALAALDTPGILVPVNFPASELPVREVEFNHEVGDLDVHSETVLPTIPVLPELAPTMLLTPPALREVGASSDYLGTVLLTEQPLSAGQRQEIARQTSEDTVGTMISFTPLSPLSGWWSVALAGTLGLGVLVVVTLVQALSWQSVRRQFALLDAIGAPPGLPSQVSGAFSGLLALAGTVCGVAAGTLGAWLLTSTTQLHSSGAVLSTGTAGYFLPDWRMQLILLVLTPVATWAVGSLFHRRLGELEYRET
ncbi:hypothetical protein, partial [Corynebacterium nasicanis]